jgi:transcriptional regulator with XRE-family HTH domain
LLYNYIRDKKIITFRNKCKEGERVKLDKLKQKRKLLGYTQEELAEQLSITLAAYRTYEQGIREMKIQTLKEIAIIFRCTIDELV